MNLKHPFSSIIIGGLSLLLLNACKTQQALVSEQTIVLDTLKVKPEKKLPYRSSRTKHIDILHTKLNLSFNWDSAFVYGEATIILKPHFYAISSLELDARGFDIQAVSMINGENQSPVKYTYDKEDIAIVLGKEYTNSDTIRLFIKYTAMPNKLKSNGSSAISDDRGMYFINGDGKDPNKPRQLWTQGETESNSCWFPTVDSPNEKFTHEMYVTIEEGQTSISNGLKMFSIENNDGSKTEYWKMDKPHSAYLVMLAVGPFAKYEDSWGDMEVNYFLDSAYLPYAKDIFGNTPEMLEFYSDYLGVKYPWPKYDQVVVHDYVSGAMENTTATIHGEFLQQTKREMLDYNNEAIIAHELFHHWFGDLVTCESWSNLTLNEGFATYGEYLWDEYKYGRDIADFEFRNTLEAYLRESKVIKKDLIRFNYNDKEDMFDSHSYSKGGFILHMLRYTVGDEAFKKSLQLYLTRYAYQNAEVHDLRLVFEEVTGEDLNWFFNQWFLGSGHPVLNIHHEYSTEDKQLSIHVTQSQDFEKLPVFRLPVKIEYMSDGKIETIEAVLENEIDTVIIDMDKAPEFVNFDPGKTVLAFVEYDQSNEEWTKLFKHATLGNDRRKALAEISDDSTTLDESVFASALKDSLWEIRTYALQYYGEKLDEKRSDSLKAVLMDIAQNDPEWRMKYMAMSTLGRYYKDDEMVELCKKNMTDESIMVTSGAIRTFTEVNPDEARKMIDKVEDYEYASIASAIAGFYTSEGKASDHSRLLEVLSHIDGYQKYQAIKEYGNYLAVIDASELNAALPFLKENAIETDQWWIRMSAQKEIIKVHARLKEELKSEVDSIEEVGNETLNTAEPSANLNDIYKIADEILKEIKETETKENLISVLDNYLDKGIVPK